MLGEGEFLTNDKKIGDAIARILQFDKSNYGAVEGVKSPLPYRSEKDFMNQNPDCCIIRGDRTREFPHRVSFADQLLGVANDWISVKYARRYKLANGEIEYEIKQRNFVINNCGEIVYD